MFTEADDRYALAKALVSKPKWTGGDEPPRLSDEEIRELARDVITGRVFLTNEPEVMELSFGLMIAMVFSQAPRAWVEKGAALYAPMSEAGDRSINGYPMFFSMKVLHIDDAPEFDRNYRQMTEALS